MNAPEPRKLRVVLALGEGTAAAQADEILARTPEFEVVARAGGCEALAAYCHGAAPDVLVVDEGLEGGECVRVAARFALERPLPTLIVTREGPEAAVDPHLARRVRMTRVPHSALSTSHGASYFRTQLRLAATRSHESKQTIGREELRGVIDSLLDEDESLMPLPPRLAELARSPLELVVLITGRAAVGDALQALARAAVLRVPVVVAVDDAADADVVVAEASRRGQRLTPVAKSMPLRRVSGRWLAWAGVEVEVARDVLSVREATLSPLNVPRLLESLVGRAQGVLVVAGPTGRADCSDALEKLGRAGAMVATLGRPGAGLPRGDFPRCDAEEIGRVLSNVRPLRV